MNRQVASWISEIREVLHGPSSPISLKNGLWRVKDRASLWKTLGPRVFDDDLDRLRRCIVEVLSERDPQFELPPSDRYAAQIHDKVLKHSPDLRKGLAESLALLGTQSSALKFCSQGKAEETVFLAMRDIFADADWVLWATLDGLLPVLAEAAPHQFLSTVEGALQQTPYLFDELFSQEGDGFFGGIYHAGLLWALETLAWDAESLVRVCVILGDLASRDPGGNRGNRPANSLATILLPWLPQTTASVEKRRVALRTLQIEFPAIAWRLLLNLLPERHQTSFHTRRPEWRNTIPDDWQEGVGADEYWQQVSSYVDMTVEMARDDLEKLKELIDRLDNLTLTAFEKVLEYLSSEAVSSQPEVRRAILWEQLTRFARRHRSFPDADWSLTNERLSEIEDVAAQIAPEAPPYQHRMLFGKDMIDFYVGNGDWNERMNQIERDRREAIAEILTCGGVEAAIRFAEAVERPDLVGHSLGAVGTQAVDGQIIPVLLETDSGKLTEFTASYVWSRHVCEGWEWTDSLDRSKWSHAELGRFLSYHPFAGATWRRVADWLGENEREYWCNDRLNLRTTDNDIVAGIDKLVDFGRPKYAVSCLQYRYPIDRESSARALLASVNSSEPVTLDVHGVVRIIKALQDDPVTDLSDLLRIEWAYLRLLDRHHDASPKTLENRLASDPESFCDVIRLVYRSSREDRPAARERNTRDQDIAANALRLLWEWQTPPGIQADGTFSPNQFKQWLVQVKETCSDSGHIEVALNNVGQVLIHCPPDPDGLWIHHSVAEELSDRNAEKMREGYSTGIFNSRGAYIVDPTGKPERELAEQWRKKAEDVENAGYQRFATTLRGLAEGYDREAERIVAEHNTEK